MVDLWAGGLSLSFVAFLEIVFSNIAVWIDQADMKLYGHHVLGFEETVADYPDGYWAFRPLGGVKGE